MNLNEVFQKVVFLLGAGASKGAGCLLSSDMLYSLKDSIDSLTTFDTDYIQYKDDFDEIYRLILASLSYQATLKGVPIESKSFLNIEDFVMVLRQLIDKEFIIPYPLIGNWNSKVVKWELRNDNVFSQFKKFIVEKLISEWTLFDLGKAETGLAPVRELLNNSSAFKINIFSLNYDMIFERVFNSETVRLLDNGFSKRTFEDQEVRYWSGDYDNELSEAKINLFKLHGSVDWEYNDDSEEISVRENFIDGTEPLIIFGSSSKMLSFDPFLYLLSSFRSCLEKATVFVVIGYSFHDKYINNLLIQQLSRNTAEEAAKKMIVVNPSLENRTTQELADELKKIQETKSIEDVINFRQVSPDRLKIESITGDEFFSQYLSNHAEKLIQELETTELGDQPFS